jgi:hypothetical protein
MLDCVYVELYDVQRRGMWHRDVLYQSIALVLWTRLKLCHPVRVNHCCATWL